MKLNEVDLNKKGIYIIKNIETENIYIGSTRDNFKTRIKNHLRELKLKIHHNFKLQKDFDIFGEDSFEIQLFPKELDDFKILELEEQLIKEQNPYYNICLNPTVGGKPNKGKTFNQEWKDNLVKSREGYKHSEEVLEKISVNNKKGGTSITISREGETINFDTIREFSMFFGFKKANHKLSRKLEYEGWKIVINKSQKKKVKLYKEEEIIIFDSSYDCDRYFNTWKGATSFYLNRDGKINDYKIEYI